MKKMFLLLIPITLLLFYSTVGIVFFTFTDADGYTVYGESFPKEEYNLSAIEACEKCLTERETGVSVRLKDGDYEKIVKKLLADEKFTENVNGTKISYYTSPFLKKYVRIRGEKINLQIAVNPDGTTIIGSPLIYGSF